MGSHNGCLQVLHIKWTLSKINVRQLIDNWFVGNNKLSVPPLKLLEVLYVQHLVIIKRVLLGLNNLVYEALSSPSLRAPLMGERGKRGV